MTVSPVCRAAEADLFVQPWGQIAWSASQKLGNSTRLTFGRVLLKAGEHTPRHRHPNCDEILYVLAGRIEHSLGEASFILETGDTISIPTGEWHGARVLGEHAAEMIICFSAADRATEFAE